MATVCVYECVYVCVCVFMCICECVCMCVWNDCYASTQTSPHQYLVKIGLVTLDVFGVCVDLSLLKVIRFWDKNKWRFHLNLQFFQSVLLCRQKFHYLCWLNAIKSVIFKINIIYITDIVITLHVYSINIAPVCKSKFGGFNHTSKHLRIVLSRWK